MIISVFSVLMSVVLCSIYIAISLVAYSRKILTNNLYLLSTLIVMCIVRLLLIVEMPFAFIVRSHDVFPALLQAARSEVLSVNGSAISIAHFIGIVWLAGSVVIVAIMFIKFCVTKRYIRKLPAVKNEKIENILVETVSKSGYTKDYKLVVSDYANI